MTAVEDPAVTTAPAHPLEPLTGDEIAAAAQLACLLEVSAPKPGNVTPEHHFHDTRYEDFLASAVAIGPALAAAGSHPLGATIRAAIVEGTADTAAQVVEIGDRRAAIDFATTWARDGDVVLIAGKGHEAGQTSGGQTRPFDDREELGRSLQALGARS